MITSNIIYQLLHTTNIIYQVFHRNHQRHHCFTSASSRRPPS